MYRSLLLVSLALASAHPLALCAAAWQGEGELGMSVTTGNTDTENLATRLGLARELERWRHAGSVEAVRARTDGATTAERYVLAAKSDYAISPTLYAFGAVRHERDEFGGFERQSTLSGGLGKRLVDDGQTALDLSAGLGLRRAKPRAGGAVEEEGIWRLGGLLTHRLNPNVAFSEEILVEAGGDNTFAQSTAGLTAKLGERLAAKLGYSVKHNTDVPPGAENTDSLTTLSLVYSF